MLRLLIIRAATALLTLLVVSILVFAAIHQIPGSYEDLILGPFQSPEARDRIVSQYALDGSLPEQFLAWARNVVTGDLGTSMASGEAVASELWRRALPTVQLAVMASLLGLIVGVPLGLVAALADRRPRLRATSRLFGALGLSLPDFVIGTILVYVFSRWSLGFTVGGYVSIFDEPLTNLKAMTLPAATLGVLGIALVMRTMRDAVLTVMAEPFTMAAVARGDSPASIIRHHVLRNSAIPIVTVMATRLGYLLGGTVIIESLFSIPGVGIYIVNAIGNRDYAVLQGGVLCAAAAFIVLNMIADVAYGFIDPRVVARGGTR